MNRFEFPTPDPLSEKFYSWSPYVYTFNNPMRFTDPTGMAPEDGFLNDLLKAINQAGQQILSTVGLSNDQLQSENPAVRADASQKREQAAETLHTVNESILSVVPGADVAYKVTNDREVTKSDVAWTVAGLLPVGKIGKVAKAAEGAGNVAKVVNKSETVLKTATGVEINGFAGHGLNRAIQRGLKPAGILDAVKNPLKTGAIVTDDLGRSSQRFVGASAEVVINPSTGTIISVNPTSTKKAAKLLRGQ